MTLVAAFLLGLVHAGHCAGMCGGFALMASGGAGGRWGLWLWFAGKTFSYAFLGAVVGSAGHVVLEQGDQLATTLGLGVGAFMVLAGARRALGRQGAAAGSTLTRWLGPLAHDASRRGGRFGLGVVSGLLPCGVTWLAALGAAPRGALGGVGFMTVFALGTAPVFIALALGGRPLMARLGPRTWARLSGLVVLASGVLVAWRTLGSEGCPACLQS